MVEFIEAWPTQRRVSCEILVGSLGSWRLRSSMVASTGRGVERTEEAFDVHDGAPKDSDCV